MWQPFAQTERVERAAIYIPLHYFWFVQPRTCSLLIMMIVRALAHMPLVVAFALNTVHRNWWTKRTDIRSDTADEKNIVRWLCYKSVNCAKEVSGGSSGRQRARRATGATDQARLTLHEHFASWLLRRRLEKLFFTEDWTSARLIQAFWNLLLPGALKPLVSLLKGKPQVTRILRVAKVLQAERKG